jgi:hypothetical protein
MRNLALDTAITLAGLTKRAVAERARIAETRLSNIVHGIGAAASNAEKSALSTVLGQASGLLFPELGAVIVEKSGSVHLGATGIRSEAAATATIIEKWLTDPNTDWRGHDAERFNVIAGLLQLRRAAGLDRIR